MRISFFFTLVLVESVCLFVAGGCQQKHIVSPSTTPPRLETTSVLPVEAPLNDLITQHRNLVKQLSQTIEPAEKDRLIAEQDKLVQHMLNQFPQSPPTLFNNINTSPPPVSTSSPSSNRTALEQALQEAKEKNARDQQNLQTQLTDVKRALEKKEKKIIAYESHQKKMAFLNKQIQEKKLPMRCCWDVTSSQPLWEGIDENKQYIVGYSNLGVLSQAISFSYGQAPGPVVPLDSLVNGFYKDAQRPLIRIALTKKTFDNMNKHNYLEIPGKYFYQMKKRLIDQAFNKYTPPQDLQFFFSHSQDFDPNLSPVLIFVNAEQDYAYPKDSALYKSFYGIKYVLEKTFFEALQASPSDNL